MKLQLNEITFIKDCIWNSTIKGSDSIFVGDVLKKILKEGDRLKALEAKKAQEMQEIYIKQ